MKRLQIEIIVLVVLLIVIGVTGAMWKHERAEHIRTKSNQDVLMGEVKRWKTSDSLNVLEVGRLTLTNKEFKQTNMKLQETAKKLNLKIWRLENASETGIVTVTKVNTIIKDSIVYRDKEPVVLKCIDFNDGWLTASGCVENGEFNGLIINRDTLSQFADRIPKFWIFGTKGIRQTIVSSNPHTEIIYHKEIIFKRNNK